MEGSGFKSKKNKLDSQDFWKLVAKFIMSERFSMGCLLCFLGDWIMLILILLILVS